MAYEPTFNDNSFCTRGEDLTPTWADEIHVKLIIGGTIHHGYAPLGDAAALAEGPQALESGCMTAVREICQRIYGRLSHE